MQWKPEEDAKSVQMAKRDKDKDFIQNNLDHLASWACPNVMPFSTVRWIIIWIKGQAELQREGCIWRGSSSEKEQKVKEDKNLALVWAPDEE